MSVKINIPSALYRFTNQQSVAEYSSGTVKELLAALVQEYGELKKHLFLEDGSLRGFVNVFVNEEDIRYLAQLDTVVKDGDEINIIPSIAGGH